MERGGWQWDEGGGGSGWEVMQDGCETTCGATGYKKDLNNGK